MDGPVLEGGQTFIKGEIKSLRIEVWCRDDLTTDISSLTATIAVYDKDGTAILTAGAAIISGSTAVLIARVWDTSSVAAGFYRCLVVVTYGSIQQKFEYGVRVLPSPAPLV